MKLVSRMHEIPCAEFDLTNLDREAAQDIFGASTLLTRELSVRNA